MDKNRYIVIMAGGIGSRFWPESTVQRPKQFLDIIGDGESLLRTTYRRCRELVEDAHIIVITNQDYTGLVHECLPEIDVKNILGEPSRNNTAPTIAWAALHLQARNENAVFAVLPSDHVILREEAFQSALLSAFDIAEKNDALITLGIEPSRPDTGYGYIEYDDSAEADNGSRRVLSFREKPDPQTAKEYLEVGRYVWNAGMFVWSVTSILDAYRRYAMDILDLLSEEVNQIGSIQEMDYINRVYPRTRSISVDYAILENAQNVLMIPVDMGWSDLGTWNSLHDFCPKDEDANVLHIGEKASVSETVNSLIRVPREKKIVIKGLDGFIVVDTKDALLIYPIDDEQAIKQAVSELK